MIIIPNYIIEFFYIMEADLKPELEIIPFDEKFAVKAEVAINP